IGNAWNWSNTLEGKLNNTVGIPISMSGAVSPNARDNARMKPVNIPGIAAGNTTRRIVCHLFAPKPYEASLTELCNDLMGFSFEKEKNRKKSHDIVKAAASTELLKASASITIPLIKIVRPSKPKTTEGTPAKFEILTLITLVNALSLAYSSK